jgi:hypothetical protein
MAATQKVVQFPTPAQAPYPAETISQTELALLISLRARLRILNAQVKENEQSLMRRLETGVPIEPGSHTAALKEHFRRCVAWKYAVVRLATRLGLDGEAYCANVLGNTKPTRTLSLFVA